MTEKPDVDPLEQTSAEPVRPSKLIAGAPIGGYSLLAVLGEGGMGVVWSAQDPLLDRTLAIKVLKSLDAAPALRLRLLREARAMARLKHPNVLTVYEVGTEGERDFIAMELVDGGPLDDWLARNPPAGEVMAALLAAGRGLAAAHAAGLVHRDFKPNNVLRSKDGRVLVTDFGLARGLGNDSPVAPITDATPHAALDVTIDASASGSSRRTDSVLDSPLTKTGAMIGTPAYMAPEQFTGSPPDPRTDQFAFCVTAWQALTGVRPHHGRTLDELRKAASAGVAAVVTDLPKPVRAVLARGLDPDPAGRWPDLEALLEALERAGRERKRSRWPLAVAAAAVVGIAFAVIATRGSKQPVAATCEPAETAFAAWSDDKWAWLQMPEPVRAYVGGALDEYRRKWSASYDQACKEAKRPKVSCLLGLRGQVAAYAETFRNAALDRAVETVRKRIDGKAVPGSMVDGQDLIFDPYAMLPQPSACTGRTLASPPAIPEDQPRRSRILAVLAKTMTLRSAIEVSKVATDLEADARANDWPPLLPMIFVAAGAEHVRRGKTAEARQMLARALAATDADSRLVAIARLAMLEASMIELEHPDDYAGTKPATMHEELTRHLTYARSAVKAAGDEPFLAGTLAMLEAEALAHLAERSPRKQVYEDALARAAEARRQFEDAGDVRRVAGAMALEASILLSRGDDRAIEDAGFAIRSAAEALERARLPHSPAIDELRARVAFARGDFDEAHRLLDRMEHVPAAGTVVHTGVVLDADGKPASGARVVAWTGELHGDPRRVFTDPRTVRGEVVDTRSDGTFEVHADAGAAIVAQRGELRSTPQAIAASNTLRLGPTTAITGKLGAPSAFGLEAFARFSIGSAAWFVHAPIGKDLTFQLGRLPRGTPQFGAVGRVGTTTRRVIAPFATRLEWPAGRVIDVVVRGPAGDTATVWMFRELTAPATRADAETLAATTTEVATSRLARIGSRTTDAGREVYTAGDRHAILTAELSGTACVAPDAAPTTPVTCRRITHDAEAAILLEIR